MHVLSLKGPRSTGGIRVEATRQSAAIKLRWQGVVGSRPFQLAQVRDVQAMLTPD